MSAKHVGWAGVFVSLVVVGYLVFELDFEAAFRAIAVARLGWLGLAALLYLLIFPIRGLRWSLLMKTVKPIPPRVATEVFIVGSMANNVMPARLGDVARAFVLSRRAQVPATATLSNVLLERVLDGVTVVGFLAFVLVTAPPSGGWVTSAGLGVAALFFAALATALLFVWCQRPAARLVDAGLRFVPARFRPRARDRIALLVAGLGVLKSARSTALAVLLSLAIWLLEVVVYALAQQAFGLTIPWTGLILVMALLTLGLTAPSGPGFVGVFEGLIMKGVGLYGVGEPVALAFAIAMHLIHYVPVTALGLVFAWRSGLKIRSLDGARAGGDAPPERAFEVSPGGV